MLSALPLRCPPPPPGHVRAAPSCHQPLLTSALGRNFICSDNKQARRPAGAWEGPAGKQVGEARPVPGAQPWPRGSELKGRSLRLTAGPRRAGAGSSCPCHCCCWRPSSPAPGRRWPGGSGVPSTPAQLGDLTCCPESHTGGPLPYSETCFHSTTPDPGRAVQRQVLTRLGPVGRAQGSLDCGYGTTAISGQWTRRPGHVRVVWEPWRPLTLVPALSF